MINPNYLLLFAYEFYNRKLSKMQPDGTKLKYIIAGHHQSVLPVNSNRCQSQKLKTSSSYYSEACTLRKYFFKGKSLFKPKK